MFLASCIGLGFIGSANQIALESGADVAVAVGLVGLLSVCNGAGRLVGGLLFDVLGTGRAMAVVAALHFLGCALAVGALVAASVPLMAVAVLVGGIGIGGVSALGSGFMATAFGPKHYAENLSILNLVLIPAALVGPSVMGTSATVAGSYVFGTAALAALGAGALGLSALTALLLSRMRQGLKRKAKTRDQVPRSLLTRRSIPSRLDLRGRKDRTHRRAGPYGIRPCTHRRNRETSLS